MDENKIVNNEENEAPIPKTNRFLFGAGCILIAAGVAIIALFGGEEADEICTDESPVGFYSEKHHPSFEIGEGRDLTYHLSDETKVFSNPKTGVKEMENKELTFCSEYTSYYNEQIDDESLKYIPEDMIKNYNWKYANAYAWYYGLTRSASLSKLKIPYIFDGGINCFTSGSQIYIKESAGENENLIPTFDLKKSAKSMEYFGIYAASAYGNLNVELTFSLLKKDNDKKFTRYNFVFDANVNKSNGMVPSFYGAYFEDFEGFDKSLLEGCSMISVSYKIKENGWIYTPEPELAEEDIPTFGFIKLYEVLLPESTW